MPWSKYDGRRVGEEGRRERVALKAGVAPAHLGPQPGNDGSEYDAEQVEFMKACEAEQRRLCVPALSPRQILKVARGLGYRVVVGPATIAVVVNPGTPSE